MPKFVYRGRDEQGRSISGEIDADNIDDAANKLFEKRIIPLQIEAPSHLINWQTLLRNNPFKKTIKRDELIAFCRQMNVLYKSGISLITALNRLSETARSHLMRQTLMNILKDVESGRELAVAMKNQDHVFPSLMINIISVGENTGKLAEAFDHLAEYLELEDITFKRIKSAVRYPIIVVTAIVVAIIILNIFVIPTFKRIFENAKTELPWATRFLIGSSNFIVNWWPYLLSFLILIMIGLKIYINTDHGRYWWHRLQLKIPIIGSILRRIVIGRFASAFALVIRTDIALPFGIELVSLAMGNVYMGKKFILMKTAISHGESIVEAIRNTQLFSPLVLQMIMVGEETGELDKMLDQVAAFYGREVDYELKRLGDLIEPILLVIIAVMVLILALGIFLPMWNLSRVIIRK